MMKFLSYIPLLFSLCSIFVASAKFNPADKIRANANKLAKQNARIAQKQQRALGSKALTVKFGGKRTGKLSNSRHSIAGLKKQNNASNMPVLQMFIRRMDTGPWSYFDEFFTEGGLRPLAEDIIESGGLQAEILRSEFENILARLKIVRKL